MNFDQLSIEDLIDSCILKELESKFDVRYSDRMFVHRPFYTNAKTVITKNGYGVKTSDEGYQLKGSENTMVQAEEVNLGIWSAPFLNMRVSQEVEGVIPYVVGFSIADAKSKQGALARTSARLMKEQNEKGITAAQSDVTAMELFASPKVTKQGTSSLYQFDMTDLLPRDDFQEEINDKYVISFIDEEDQEAQFYYRINMKKRGKILSALSKPWLEAIERDGLSHSYDPKTGILYVSNAVGAAYGLPPNPIACQMPPLGLTLEDWAEVAPKPSTPTGKKAKAEAADCTQGQELVEQFLNLPNEANYREMIADEGVKQLFKTYKDNVRYKLGTNKDKLTTVLRKKMAGEEGATTWTGFAEHVKDTACPKDTIASALLMVKNLSVLRTTEGGLVYYDE